MPTSDLVTFTALCDCYSSPKRGGHVTHWQKVTPLQCDLST